LANTKWTNERTTYAEWEEEGEPTHHLGTDQVHSLWMYAQPNVAVQVRLEISGKSVAGTGMGDAKREMR